MITKRNTPISHVFRKNEYKLPYYIYFILLFVSCTSNSPDEYYSRGIKIENLKDYKGAIEEYTKAIEIDSNYYPAYITRGNAKTHLHDFDSALEDYNKAIEIDSNNGIAYCKFLPC